MIPVRKLGTQGLEVPAIGLGCMGMTGSYGPADRQESFAVLDRAVELGAGFLDTAEVYGPYANEELIGAWLKTRRRDDVILATKFGFRIGAPEIACDSSPDAIRRAVDGSLRRLGVETIDLLYQHRVDPAVPIEEVVGVMAELVSAGKVRFLGLSEAGAATIARAHAVHPISALQSEYSLWERHLEPEILPLLRRLGIGLVPFSPLGRGFLAGSGVRAEDAASTDFRSRDPRFSGANYDANLRLAQMVREIATDEAATPAQIALSWLLERGNDVVPIPGTRRVDRLEENLAALDVRIPDDLMDELDSAMPRAAGDRFNPTFMALVDR